MLFMGLRLTGFCGICANIEYRQDAKLSLGLPVVLPHGRLSDRSLQLVEV